MKKSPEGRHTLLRNMLVCHPLLLLRIRSLIDSQMDLLNPMLQRSRSLGSSRKGRRSRMKQCCSTPRDGASLRKRKKDPEMLARIQKPRNNSSAPDVIEDSSGHRRRAWLSRERVQDDGVETVSINGSFSFSAESFGNHVCQSFKM